MLGYSFNYVSTLAHKVPYSVGRNLHAPREQENSLPHTHTACCWQKPCAAHTPSAVLPAGGHRDTGDLHRGFPNCPRVPHPSALPPGTRLGCRPACWTPQPLCPPQQWQQGVTLSPAPARSSACPAGWRGRTSSPAPQTLRTARSGMRLPIPVLRGAAGPHHLPCSSLVLCPARSSGAGRHCPQPPGTQDGCRSGTAQEQHRHQPTAAHRGSCPPQHVPEEKTR